MQIGKTAFADGDLVGQIGAAEYELGVQIGKMASSDGDLGGQIGAAEYELDNHSGSGFNKRSDKLWK